MGDNRAGLLSPIERFRLHMVAPDERGCIATDLSKDRKGYARFTVVGKSILAHRFAMQIALGRRISADICVCHSCDNPACVNPAHLFLGTYADNNRDRDAKGRQRAPNGERQGLAKLTETQVREILASHEVSTTRLAARYGCSDTNIHYIRTRKTWRHVRMEG